MALFLRIIKPNKWLTLSIESRDWTKTRDFPADPVTDLKTTDDKLSLFRVENKKDDLIHLIALNFCEQRISDLDYMLIDETILATSGFQIGKSSMDSKFTKVDDAHFDIENLTGKKLIKLAKLLYYRKSGSGQLTKSEIKQAYMQAIQANEFKRPTQANALKEILDGKKK